MVICKSVFNSLQSTLPECVASTGLWRFLVIWSLCIGMWEREKRREDRRERDH